jgi:hypothetical protein
MKQITAGGVGNPDACLEHTKTCGGVNYIPHALMI